MVWGLFSVDPSPGALKYYIFSKGSYTVGRKGCDLIIQTDRTISRVHAEVVVDAMTCQDPSQNKSNSLQSDVQIKDLSKFGTFINKEIGSNPIFSYPDKVATLKIGDLVTFGTGNATFRFCFVPLVIFVYSAKPSKASRALKGTISSIEQLKLRFDQIDHHLNIKVPTKLGCKREKDLGRLTKILQPAVDLTSTLLLYPGAYATHKWSPECTHVLVDESSPITEGLIDAIVAQKPVILSDWVKAIAEKKVCVEIPSWSFYIPTLTLGERNSTSVKIVEPKVRENCLAGYTFILGSSHLYKFVEKCKSLLEVAGARVLHVDLFCSSNQIVADGSNNRVVLVIPEKSATEFNQFHQLRSLPRVKENKLVAAALCGHFDASFVELPSTSVLVSSSHSTDETVVPDSDVDTDTATSDRIAATSDLVAATSDQFTAIQSKQTTKCEDEEVGAYSGNVEPVPEKTAAPTFTVDGGMIERRNKGEESEQSMYQNSDIIFSQDLMVTRNSRPTSVKSKSKKEAVNFKHFRKVLALSGNSFKDLIPFAKDPYQESDYANEKNEYVREEKKRKELEAMAEDLFNNERAKRQRGIAGSTLKGLMMGR